MSIVRCARCNRVLKDTDCIHSGYGRSCYKKVFGKSISKGKKIVKLRSYRPSNISFRYKETPPLYKDEENFKERGDLTDEQPENLGYSMHRLHFLK